MKTSKLTKDMIINELRSMVEPRLFDGMWPIPVEEIPATNKKLAELGLLAPDGVWDDGSERFKTTDLGRELDVDLWSSVFIGEHCTEEIPVLLQDNGFIKRDELEAIHDKMFDGPSGNAAVEEHWRSIVYPVVRSAYLRFQGRRQPSLKLVDDD